MLNLFLEIISVFFVFTAISFFPRKEYIKLFGKSYHKLFLSNISFAIANFFTTFYALFNGYIPLLVQMIIFSIFSFIGIKTYSKKNINIKILLNTYIFLVFFGFLLVNGINMKITITEIIAAIFAIIGTFYMNIFKNLKIALILFVIADTLYAMFFTFEQVWLYVLQYTIFIMVNVYALIKNYTKS